MAAETAQKEKGYTSKYIIIIIIIIIIHCAPALAQAPWTLVTIILRPVAVG